MRFYCLVFAFLFTLFLVGCGEPAPPAFQPEVPELPADPSDYAPIDNYQAMPIPASNPITAEKAALGRQLYYDKRLSGDGQLSCYSCHVCQHGLSDGRPTAVGAFGKQLTRNAPTVWNIGYHAEFYWDGRAPSLEAQALAAWKGGNMGADADKVVGELNQIAGYTQQFQSVFGSDATPENVSQALASYMRTIISDDTPWDRWQAGDESAVSDAAKRGYDVFQQAKCNGCHAPVLFTDLVYHNVGIGMDAEQPDVGRFKVSNNERDMGAFKTPTLRDITKSGPYFHNGSVATLDEAVDTMLAGGIPNDHLDTANLQPAELTPEQRADLLEFLSSLEQPCNLDQMPKIPE